MPVLQLFRRLEVRPVATPAAGIVVRTFQPTDLPGWLRLRDRAFAAERPPARPWSEEDFQREMSAKPWWSPERLWLAEEDSGIGSPVLAGAVCLALRESGAESKAAIHWLMVDPAYRQRGIARALVTTLEAAAWDAGFREVVLETHSGWTSAMRLYRALGYGTRVEGSALGTA